MFLQTLSWPRCLPPRPEQATCSSALWGGPDHPLGLTLVAVFFVHTSVTQFPPLSELNDTLRFLVTLCPCDSILSITLANDGALGEGPVASDSSCLDLIPCALMKLSIEHPLCARLFTRCWRHSLNKMVTALPSWSWWSNRSQVSDRWLSNPSSTEMSTIQGKFWGSWISMLGTGGPDLIWESGKAPLREGNIWIGCEELTKRKEGWRLRQSPEARNCCVKAQDGKEPVSQGTAKKANWPGPEDWGGQRRQTKKWARPCCVPWDTGEDLDVHPKSSYKSSKRKWSDLYF